MEAKIGSRKRAVYTRFVANGKSSNFVDVVFEPSLRENLTHDRVQFIDKAHLVFDSSGRDEPIGKSLTIVATSDGTFLFP